MSAFQRFYRSVGQSAEQGIQELIQAPATGLLVGGGTATFGFLNDLASTAEQIGMIAGAALTVGLLLQFIYKQCGICNRWITEWKENRKG